MRVIIADHNSKTRKALKSLFREEPGVDVIGVASSASELLSLAKNNPVDVIMLEYALPWISITDLIAQVRGIHPAVKVVVMSSDPENARFALLAGADAFVSKSDTPDLLLDALHRCETQ